MDGVVQWFFDEACWRMERVPILGRVFFQARCWRYRIEGWGD
jgi:hypothetical protein